MRVVEHTRSRSGANQPISQHPLFPAIVALWFGALFGLGSLAIRPALVEHFVIATGIDTIIPMATPPQTSVARGAGDVPLPRRCDLVSAETP